MKPNVAEILARANGIVPGPWEVTPNLDTIEVRGQSHLRDIESTGVNAVVLTGVAPHELAEFIAAAITDVPQLCARVEELEAALRDALFAADHLGDELNAMDVAGDDPKLGEVSTAMTRARAALEGS